MSDDYAALLTTLIVAIFAVGTIQTYTLMRLLGQKLNEDARRKAEAQHRVLRALRDAQAPEEQDLTDAYEPAVDRIGLPRKELAVYTAGVTWTGMVIVLGTQQIKILRWAGSAAHPKDPELAEGSFFLVSIAIAVLLVEGVVRALAQSHLEFRAITAPLRQYTKADRKRMRQVIRQYRSSGQVPTPPAPPFSP
ncbi:hypothetical protein ACFCXS_33720 [Streptomyces sp. NPDC056373]|uniref:hypothetical protein n=1 Tax=Streptomyces sp. NPDC056373 TaxID=3345798 RepID=UPI0035DDEF83